MNLFNALILGLVEGVTEFLPISSTAHLILASKLLKIPQTDFQKFFEVFIQSGAIIAVFFMYLKYIINNEHVQFKILFSFIPTAVIGFVLFRVIKNIFFVSDALIIAAIFLIGAVFILLEYLIKKKNLQISKTISNINYKDAFIIGLGQSLAVLPGVSRAGIVMVVMMLMGYKREDSATYSFLLAIPTILAASFYDLYKIGPFMFLYSNKSLYLVLGFISAFVAAWISVRWLISYLKKNTLVPFGIYRILLAIILVLILFK